ncbi:MAG TPA: hypothetical protein VGD45_14080 [Steroidobacter sp.]|uniref:hypothetical protein n=1 Tax=Steroidobacter sp. TaxID=1978227 RepID=UPI002EDB46A2
MKNTKALLILLLFAGTAVAHKDRMITIGSDGSLQGLPEKYQPARLIWSDSVPTLNLRIGAHETVLPSCLTSIFSLERAELRVSASWYHDTSRLPPYIGIDIVHSVEGQTFFNGFSLLFNLDTGELIQVDRVIATQSEERSQDVEIAALCSGGEADTMVHVVSQ